MPAELRKTVSEYKTSTEEEAMQLYAELKEESSGVLSIKTVYKTKTSKGEIVDAWWISTITEDFTK